MALHFLTTETEAGSLWEDCYQNSKVANNIIYYNDNKR